MDNRAEVRTFLKSRRDKITPEQAGVQSYGELVFWLGVAQGGDHVAGVLDDRDDLVVAAAPSCWDGTASRMLEWTLTARRGRQDAAGGRADRAPYRSAGIPHTWAPVHIRSCGNISN